MKTGTLMITGMLLTGFCSNSIAASKQFENHCYSSNNEEVKKLYKATVTSLTVLNGVSNSYINVDNFKGYDISLDIPDTNVIGPVYDIAKISYLTSSKVNLCLVRNSIFDKTFRVTIAEMENN